MQNITVIDQTKTIAIVMYWNEHKVYLYMIDIALIIVGNIALSLSHPEDIRLDLKRLN